MASIRLSAAARSDLAAIEEYGARNFGDEAAAVYLRGFREAFLLLQAYPLAGRPRPELRDGTRSRLHRSHVIFYRAADNTVFIQRILHHAQDVPAHLKP